jgi:hypothetical protein
VESKKGTFGLRQEPGCPFFNSYRLDIDSHQRILGIMSCSNSSENGEYKPFQFTLRSLLIFVFIVAVILSFLMTLKAMFDNLFAVHWKPVADRSQWTRDLQDFIKDADQKNVKIEVVKVYNLVGGFWDDENFWLIKYSPELLELMCTNWSLSKTNRNTRWVEEAWGKMPDELKPKESDKIELYISAGWLKLAESDRYIVINDITSEHIIVWYYFDF